MKRQGKYGFTFDSKAEEWAACAAVAATLALVLASVEGWI
jgi:hypothetical protein